MRAFAVLVAFIAIVLANLLAGGRAGHATVGPWCLYDRNGNPLDCSFVSQEQCLQTARGTAAHCYPNPDFVPARSRSRR